MHKKARKCAINTLSGCRYPLTVALNCVVM